MLGLAWRVPGVVGGSCPFSNENHSAASGGAGALRAPFVVVVAEGAAAADDAKNKHGQAKQARPSQASQAKSGLATPAKPNGGVVSRVVLGPTAGTE